MNTGSAWVSAPDPVPAFIVLGICIALLAASAWLLGWKRFSFSVIAGLLLLVGVYYGSWWMVMR